MSSNTGTSTLDAFVTVLRHSPLPTWLQKCERLLYVNPACLTLFDAASPEQLLQHPPSALLSLEIGSSPLTSSRARIQTLNGASREVSVTAWPVPLGSGTAVQVTLQARSAESQHSWDILDSLFAFVGVLDCDGILLDANHAPLEAAGIRLEDVIGKPFPDAYWWSYSSEVQEQLWEAIRRARNGESPRYDVAVRMRNDSRMTIDFMIAPMRNQAGAITHLIPSGVDVTERLRAEEALRESERRFRGTFENAAVGIAHVHPSGRWLAVNERLCEILGYERQELLKRTFQEITHPDDLERDLQLAGLLGAGRIPSYQMEKRYIRADGGSVWASLTGSTVRDSEGGLLYYIAVVQDISERKAAEEAVRRSNAEFQALADSIPQLVWMAEPDGKVFWYNRRWCKYAGDTATFESSLHPDDAPAVGERWRQSLRLGEPFDMTFRIVGTEQEYRPFLTRITPLVTETGTVVRWFGTATDISDQRATEDALRAANDELQQFAFAVSHDLQEPLRTVHLYSELLIRRFATEKDYEAREFAEIVQSSVRRMTILIRDLLDYSRLIHTESDWLLQPVDLGRLVGETLHMFGKQIAEEGAVVTVGELPRIRGDHTQLLQLFQNLIGNALKYRKSGENAQVDIHADLQGDEWVISVRDRGIGFSQLYAERIFGLFKRLHKDDYPGTGLGLAICRRIVKAHGGRIWAESEEGMGATFYVALPVANELAA